jgi:multidrug efflux pump subunit AcrA (membrane-fusion protein)
VAIAQRHPVIVPQGGRLASINVQVGSVVEAGQPLGTVEVPGLAQELEAAQAELGGLEATLAADPERARRFAKDTSGAQARWLAARVALESQRAELVARELELARLQAPGVAVHALQVEIDARAGELSALAEAYADARARASGGVDPVLESQVQAASARVESIRVRLDNGILRAPAPGVVAAPQVVDGGRTLDVGTLPSPGVWLPSGAPAFVVVETEAAVAVVYLPAARARGLTAGASVSLNAADGRSIEAKVVDIGPSVESIPLQQLHDPTLPEWGVAVRVRPVTGSLVPGELLAVSL